MKTIRLLLFTGLMSISLLAANAQKVVQISYKTYDKNPDIEQMEQQKLKVEQVEKNLLKEEIRAINEKLAEGEITTEEAENLKTDAAAKRAENILNQQRIIEANIELIKNNNTEEDNIGYYRDMKYLNPGLDTVRQVKKSRTKKRKTFGFVTAAVGFSNTVGDNISYGERYKKLGSRFFEVGYEWSTGLTKDNFFRINYGLNFQFNGLKPKGNFYFEERDGQIELQESEVNFKKSKLNITNLVVPLHFEIGSTNRKGYANKFKLGIGGYAGLNLSNKQKLKYRVDNDRIKRKKSFNAQSEDWVYGLSGYIGYESLAFYIKYDLNPVFKHNEIKENVIGAGVRFMF